MDLIITEGALQDFTLLANLYCDVFTSEPWFEPWTYDSAYKRLKELNSYANSILLLAKSQEEELLGFCLGNVMPWHDSGYFELREFCTHPRFRRMGIAKELLTELEKKLQFLGIGGIMLMTRKGSEAEKFYRANGFGDNQTEVILEKGG